MSDGVYFEELAQVEITDSDSGRIIGKLRRLEIGEDWLFYPERGEEAEPLTAVQVRQIADELDRRNGVKKS